MSLGKLSMIYQDDCFECRSIQVNSILILSYTRYSPAYVSSIYNWNFGESGYYTSNKGMESIRYMVLGVL